MLYLFLMIPIAILAVFAMIAFRFLKGVPGQGREILIGNSNKRAIVMLAAAALVPVIVILVALASHGGFTGFGAFGAAKDYLRGRFGAAEGRWKITVGEHDERSKNPPAGTYMARYIWDGRQGTLRIEYSQQDGKTTYNVKPIDGAP